MPFDFNKETGKLQFSFTNFLAFFAVLQSTLYFFWMSFVLTKSEQKDNASLNQITIVQVAIITLVLNYFFGNSNNSRQQQQQITEMQKTATVLATKTADATIAAVTADKWEDKLAKLNTIEELKNELTGWPPDGPQALKILEKLKGLENK